MDNNIQNYRQPMVTVTGIFLGFLFSVANGWASKAFTSERVKEVIIALGLCVCITLLLIVLYRILNMNYPKDRAQAYYKRTLLLFIIGLSAAFLSIVAVMVESYIIHRS